MTDILPRPFPRTNDHRDIDFWRQQMKTELPTNTNVDLESEVSGVLPESNGGTGESSYSDGELLIGQTSTTGLVKGNLSAGSSKLSVTNGSGSISLDVVQGNIDHDSLSGFVLAEHRALNDSTTSTTTLWSSDKISSELDDMETFAVFLS